MVTMVLKKLLFALIVQILALNPCQCHNHEEKKVNVSEIYWTHHIELPGGFQFKWVSTEDTWITMEMSAPTKGYLGIGFSPKGGMSGSDIILAWVDDAGKAHFKDYHGTKNGAPVEDEKQDYELLAAKENENGTSVIFRRKWDTCDDKNDMKLGDDTVKLIWAWHKDDPKDNELHWHGPGVQRGTKSVYLKVVGKPKHFPDDDPKAYPGVLTWDIKVENFTVPNASSYYHCKIVKFPKLDKKHHVIGYKPLIIPERVPYIHHASAFRCHVPEHLGSIDAIFGKYVGQEGMDCLDSGTPKEWMEYCFTFLIATAVGSEGDIFPNHLGFPIGEESENMYLRLEIHYENPNSLHMIDNSGLRMFYTPQLREYDIAMMFAGHRRTPFLSIPPHQKQFKISGHCPSECTEIGLPKEGVKFISVLLHAHLTGRKLRLRHIRAGKELPIIAEDNAYDFNYQEFRILPKEVLVLPGDELIMECDLNSEDRQNFTLGGFASKNEMCEAFVYYYPKSSLVDCRSQPELYSYLEAIDVHNITGDLLKKLNLPYNPNLLPGTQGDFALPDDSLVMYGINQTVPLGTLFNTLQISSGPKDFVGKHLLDYLVSLNWKDETLAKKIEKAWTNGPRYAHCSAPKGIRIKQKHHILPISKFQELPAEETQRHCEHHHDHMTPTSEPAPEPEAEANPEPEPESESKPIPEITTSKPLLGAKAVTQEKNEAIPVSATICILIVGILFTCRLI